jgi:glutamyl-tRNA synthetase
LIAPHVQPRLVTFSDLEGTVDFLFGPVSMDEASWEKAMTTEFAPALLAATRVAYADLPDWSADALKEALESVMEPFELKLGKAQAPVRVAVTGRTVGPPLFESLEALGREESLARIDAAISRLLG